MLCFSDYYSKGENELRILGWGALGGDPYGGSNLLFKRCVAVKAFYILHVL